MIIRILALGAMLAIGTSVATAQTPAKDKSAQQEKKRDKEKWGEKKGQKGSDDARKSDGRWGAQRRLLGGIQLTDAQKTSIKAIHAKYEPRMSAIRDTLRMNHKADMKPSASDPLHARAQELVKQERAEIRAVLTAEQQVRFDQNVAKFDERRDGRGKRGDRGGRGSQGDRSR